MRRSIAIFVGLLFVGGVMASYQNCAPSGGAGSDNATGNGINPGGMDLVALYQFLQMQKTWLDQAGGLKQSTMGQAFTFHTGHVVWVQDILPQIMVNGTMLTGTASATLNGGVKVTITAGSVGSVYQVDAYFENIDAGTGQPFDLELSWEDQGNSYKEVARRKGQLMYSGVMAKDGSNTSMDIQDASGITQQTSTYDANTNFKGLSYLLFAANGEEDERDFNYTISSLSGTYTWSYYSTGKPNLTYLVRYDEYWNATGNCLNSTITCLYNGLYSGGQCPQPNPLNQCL